MINRQSEIKTLTQKDQGNVEKDKNTQQRQQND